MEDKNINVNDVIKMMNKATEGFNYEIFVPSLNRTVMFRQISTSQQKRLVKAILDSPAYNTEFIWCLKQIIDENCVESIVVKDLTIYDKLIIAIMMRAVSIGNDFELHLDNPTKNADGTSEKIVRVIKLKDLVDLALSTIKIDPIVISDDNKTFEIFCDLPTIQDEYNLEKELRQNVSTIEIKNEKELRETIGEVFINELVKYIKKINIKTDDQVVEIDLKNVTFKNRLQIISTIPATLTNSILEYMKTVNKEFEKVLLFKDTINDQVVEQRLKIDASFFIRS